MKGKWRWGAPLLVMAGAVAITLSAMKVVRYELHRLHPEVSFASIDLNGLIHGVSLHNVRIDKGWIQVQAERADIDWDFTSLHLQKGSATLTMDRSPQGPAASTKHLRT
jgi:hypothetical protein